MTITKKLIQSKPYGKNRIFNEQCSRLILMNWLKQWKVMLLTGSRNKRSWKMKLQRWTRRILVCKVNCLKKKLSIWNDWKILLRKKNCVRASKMRKSKNCCKNTLISSNRHIRITMRKLLRCVKSLKICMKLMNKKNKNMKIISRISKNGIQVKFRKWMMIIAKKWPKKMKLKELKSID